jgi:hypothetical protein
VLVLAIDLSSARDRMLGWATLARDVTGGCTGDVVGCAELPPPRPTRSQTTTATANAMATTAPTRGVRPEVKRVLVDPTRLAYLDMPL